jgi:hypothetical protein
MQYNNNNKMNQPKQYKTHEFYIAVEFNIAVKK